MRKSQNTPSEEAKNYEFDNVDLQILSILMQDAKTPYTKIGEKIHVSAGTVHVRMKKMEEEGIVRGQELKVDHEKLGYDVTAFLGIYLQQSSMYETVADAFKQIPEIVAVYYTTGNYSMFIQIICRDTNHLKDVLYDKIQQIEGIQRTETFISLEERFTRPLKLLTEKE